MRSVACLFLVAPLAAQSIITTFAGTGGNSFSGDRGPAGSAALNTPSAVAVSVQGEVFLLDEANGRLRVVDAAGRIRTAVSGLNAAKGFCLDNRGVAFVVDTGARRVVDVFGNTVIGAGLTEPTGCAIREGILHVADRGAHRVFRWEGGALQPVAGTGARGFGGDAQAAASALLDSPFAIAFDAQGRLYISDQGNHRIRRVSASGVMETVAGNGLAAFDGERTAATAASLSRPAGIYVEQSGSLYIADSANHRVRRVTPDGVITTVIGNGAGAFRGDGAQAQGAAVNTPLGIALEASGALYVADSLNHRIRRVTPLGPVRPPDIPVNGVVNAASFAVGLPRGGGLATIFGTNLSPANGIATTSASPWPLLLHGVSVFLNGAQAPVYGLSNVGGQEQVSFLVPFELTGATVELVLENNGARSNPVLVPVREAPGLFRVGTDGAFLNQAFGLISVTNPVRVGQPVLAFLTGLGPVTPAVATGFPAPGAEPLARTNTVPAVTVGGVAAEVLYSGLAPGFTGLYQVNFNVPPGVTGGRVEVVIGGSNAAGLWVR